MSLRFFTWHVALYYVLGVFVVTAGPCFTSAQQPGWKCRSPSGWGLDGNSPVALRHVFQETDEMQCLRLSISWSLIVDRLCSSGTVSPGRHQCRQTSKLRVPFLTPSPPPNPTQRIFRLFLITRICRFCFCFFFLIKYLTVPTIWLLLGISNLFSPSPSFVLGFPPDHT